MTHAPGRCSHRPKASLLVLAVGLAVIVAHGGGCLLFDGRGDGPDSDAGQSGADASSDVLGDAQTPGDTDPSGEVGTCGGCSGATPHCDPQTGECVACEPSKLKTWYPDGDGDDYGKAGAEGHRACEAPMSGMVAAGKEPEDCDDADPSVHPGAAEVCNGVDEDCDRKDDTNDGMIEAGECAKQKGVCEGATVATCNAAGDDYATCGTDHYGDAYIEADDEGWRCDGADNDCDGTQDEACCPTGQTPTAVQVGPDGQDQAHPALVAAPEDAPQGSRWLAGWAESSELGLQHLDEKGMGMGTPKTRSLEAITGLTLAATSSNYLAVTTQDGTFDTLVAYRYGAGLGGGGTEFPIDSSATGELLNPAAATDGSTVWIAYSSELTGTGHAIKVAGVDVAEGKVTTGPVQVTKAGWRLPKPGAPAIAVVDGTPTVAWWDASNSLIRGARLEGKAVKDQFKVSVQLVNSVVAEPIALLAHDGDAVMVYPDYTHSGEAALNVLSVGPNQTGTVSGSQPLTGEAKLNRQPAARGVDTDADGTADRLVTVWAQGTKTDPSVMVGGTELDSPSKISARMVRKAGANATSPLVPRSGAPLGSLYLETDRVDNVKFAPLSLEGVPICSP